MKYNNTITDQIIQWCVYNTIKSKIVLVGILSDMDKMQDLADSSIIPYNIWKEYWELKDKSFKDNTFCYKDICDLIVKMWKSQGCLQPPPEYIHYIRLMHNIEWLVYNATT